MRLDVYIGSINPESFKVKKEFLDNPPNCDIVIKNCDDDMTIHEADTWYVEGVPTCILFDDNGQEIGRWVSIINSDNVNNKIKEYESKCLV